MMAKLVAAMTLAVASPVFAQTILPGSVTGPEALSNAMCAADEILKKSASGGTVWRCDVDAGAGSGAPLNAEYVTTQDDATLTNDVFPSAADQTPVTTSSTAGTWTGLPDSDGATQKLQYDTTAHTFSAGTDDDIPETGDFGGLVGGVGIDNNGPGTLDLDLTEITCSPPLSCAATTITTSMNTNKLIGRGTAAVGVMEEITLGTNLSFAGTTLNATGGGDSISVGGSAATDANFLDSTWIDFVLDTAPTPDTITANVITNSIGNTQLRQGVATSVIGRSANSTGNVADIAATTYGQLMRRSSTDVLEFAFQDAVTIDADPSGSTYSDGIQAAVDACPGTGQCIVQLRCNTTYTIDTKSNWGGATSAVNIGSKDDLWIRGCGAGTLVTYTDNITTSPSTKTSLFDIAAGANNILMSDFEAVMHDTCTSGCGSLVDSGIITIGSDASYIQIWNMQLYSTEDVTSDATNGSLRNIYVTADTGFTPDKIPRRVWIFNNDIQASNRGVELQYCDHCWVTNNYINFLGKGDDSTTPGTCWGIIKYEGVGVELTGNIIKMGLDGYTNPLCFTSGIGIVADAGSVVEAGNNIGALVQQNTFDGLRTSNQIGVNISGYASSTITGNFFSSGQCSASATRSCYVDEDCEDLGGTCSASFGIGVAFTADATDNDARNRGNVVSGNTFKRFTDDNGSNCPIRFDAVSGTDPTENGDNVIADNVFWLSTTTDDGFCGDSTIRDRNRILGNYTVGSNDFSDSSLLGYLDSGTANPANNQGVVIDTNGDGSTITNDVLAFRSAAENFFLFPIREYPTTNGQIPKYNSANGDVEWATDSGGGGGGNTVEATVDFAVTGSTSCTAAAVPFPCCTGSGTGTCGAFDASIVVTGQAWVTGTSKIVCNPTMMSTADRPDGNDDALLDQLTTGTYARVAGTGFTIKAHAPMRAFGKFLIQCMGA